MAYRKPATDGSSLIHIPIKRSWFGISKFGTSRRTNFSGSRDASNIPEWASNQELTRQSSTVIERLSYIDPGENAWNAKRLPRDRLKFLVPRISSVTFIANYTRINQLIQLRGSGGGGTHMYEWEAKPQSVPLSPVTLNGCARVSEQSETYSQQLTQFKESLLSEIRQRLALERRAGIV